MEAGLVYAPNLVYNVSPRSHRHPSRAYNYARFISSLLENRAIIRKFAVLK